MIRQINNQNAYRPDTVESPVASPLNLGVTAEDSHYLSGTGNVNLVRKHCWSEVEVELEIGTDPRLHTSLRYDTSKNYTKHMPPWYCWTPCCGPIKPWDDIGKLPLFVRTGLGLRERSPSIIRGPKGFTAETSLKTAIKKRARNLVFIRSWNEMKNNLVLKIWSW